MRGRWVVAGVVVLAACGSDESSGGADRPTVAVTTDLLGDVVTNLVGSEVDVVVVMPRGVSAHDFQPSAAQVDQLTSADVIVANGGGFEAGLVDAIEQAEADGTPVIELLDHVTPLPDDDHEAEDHEEEGHEEEGHEHHGVDPHFFNDPARMAEAGEALVTFLAEQTDLDTGALLAVAAPYLAELADLDSEVIELLEPVTGEAIVTNHDVFAYFADRYGLEVVGTVIPSTTTDAQPSAQELAELAGVIETEGVTAVFADVASPSRLADALADEVGDIEVVELFSESLGEGAETYLDMIRINASRIAAALS